MLRIGFYEYDFTKNSDTDEVAKENITWRKAVPCYDLFNSAEVFEEEFNKDGNYTWYCPDVKNITLNNDPYLYDYGKGRSFVMVVNSCHI